MADTSLSTPSLEAETYYASGYISSALPRVQYTPVPKRMNVINYKLI
jgi:hypothetical protein